MMSKVLSSETLNSNGNDSRVLPLQLASREALAPFGEIIGPSAGVKPTTGDFYKGKIKMSYPAQFACDHPFNGEHGLSPF
jgi:hypothetical protein